VDLEALAAPIYSENINETTSKGDAWILEVAQLLLTKKKSTKQLPKVTRGFGRARSPC
jgi:hypothetical protein